MSSLEVFISVLTLFVIGAVTGWVIEVFFRRIFSAKKWLNPGFLVGPYLPIYGFGTVILYGLSNITFSFIDKPLTIIIKILMISISITLLEFIAGLIFIKGLKIKLWDYSREKGNILGIICPRYSLIWLVVAIIYYFFINPYLVEAVYWLAGEEHQIYYFFIGIVIGMMIVDFAYSTHIATKIRSLAKKYNVVVNFDNFKEQLKEKTKNLINRKDKPKKNPLFLLFRGSNKTLDEYMQEYLEDKK